MIKNRDFWETNENEDFINLFESTQRKKQNLFLG
jgi:hypothetical protein